MSVKCEQKNTPIFEGQLKVDKEEKNKMKTGYESYSIFTGSLKVNLKVFKCTPSNVNGLNHKKSGTCLRSLS